MRICTDSGFLIAVYDEKDDKHREALRFFSDKVERGPHQLLVPWPVMYESISTRMARAQNRMIRINAHLKSLRVNRKLQFVDDSSFREKAITECFAAVETRSFRPLSLVDLVIRAMLADRELRADALITFNARDFRDVLLRFRKKLLPG